MGFIPSNVESKIRVSSKRPFSRFLASCSHFHTSQQRRLLEKNLSLCVRACVCAPCKDICAHSLMCMNVYDHISWHTCDGFRAQAQMFETGSLAVFTKCGGLAGLGTSRNSLVLPFYGRLLKCMNPHHLSTDGLSR